MILADETLSWSSGKSKYATARDGGSDQHDKEGLIELRTSTGS